MVELDITNSQLFEQLKQFMSNEIRDEIKKEIVKENRKIIEHLQNNSQRISQLENNCKSLEIRINYLEKVHRKNNIVIYGLTVPDTTNIVNFVLNILNNLLDIQLTPPCVNNIFQLNGGKGESTPLKIEFTSYLVKQLIFQNVRKFKGTNIFIAHDMCKQDREDNKILYAHLKAARSKSLDAKIRGKTLIVGGETHTLEQLIAFENSEPISPEDIAGHTQLSRSASVAISSTPNQLGPSGSNIEALNRQSGITTNNLGAKRSNTTLADPVLEKEKSNQQRRNDFYEKKATGRVTRSGNKLNY